MIAVEGRNHDFTEGVPWLCSFFCLFFEGSNCVYIHASLYPSILKKFREILINETAKDFYLTVLSQKKMPTQKKLSNLSLSNSEYSSTIRDVVNIQNKETNSDLVQ